MTEPTIKYEEIEDTPASTLMQLPFAELSNFIREADRRIEKEKTLRHWITWIKIEKALRKKDNDLCSGGAG